MEQKKENELTTDELQSVSGGEGDLKMDDYDYEERWKGMELKPGYQTTAMQGGNDGYFGRPGKPKK